EFTRRYRSEGYWLNLSLGERFDQAVARFDRREAVVDGSRRFTYRDLGRLVDRFAGCLIERGIVSGKRVIFQLPNVWEFIVAYFACLKVGAVPVT
ncbi:MAG: AMP-binding protein, partial [Deltaproteobacteria bacterium]|nr:AMP-binding protein [Deltaproteobacteria bacterium]